LLDQANELIAGAAQSWCPLQNLAPLLIVKLRQFELGIGEWGFIHIGLLDRAQALLLADHAR
jgi:hypothetical protein